MKKIRSFQAFLADCFYDALLHAVECWLTAHSSGLTLRRSGMQEWDEAAVEDLSIRTVHVDDRPGMAIAFDVLMETELTLTQRVRSGERTQEAGAWFCAHCAGDLERGLQSFRVLRVEEYAAQARMEQPLSDALVPYLSREELEPAAEALLQAYFPEALAAPTPVNPKILARRMGLNVRMQELTEDLSIFGMVLFFPCACPVWSSAEQRRRTTLLPAGTILVDPRVYLLRTLGSVNNTIVHECVHWARHRKAFALEKLWNPEASHLRCEVLGGIRDADRRTAADWMEWQAVQLAPRILMPRGPFRQKAEELLDTARRETGSQTLLPVIEPVIDKLAAFFGVSRHAAKIRMAELGWEEAAGAFVYLNGAYTLPYAVPQEVQRKKRTYSVPLQAAAELTLRSKELQEQIWQGAYVYAEGHLCLNDARYLTSDADGCPALTEYARMHMDECCLAFAMHWGGWSAQYYSECFLCRSADPGPAFSFSLPESENDTPLQTAGTQIAARRALQEEARHLPEAFSEALSLLMERQKCSCAALARRARLTEPTIRKLLQPGAQPDTVKTITALCLGLGLAPELSRALLARSGLVLRPEEKRSHLLYGFLLACAAGQPLQVCNRYLSAASDPATEKGDRT